MTPADLRAARIRLGLSQRKLAQVFGVPQQTVSRWECGLIAIQHPLIIALALKELERSNTTALPSPGHVIERRRDRL